MLPSKWCGPLLLCQLITAEEESPLQPAMWFSPRLPHDGTHRAPSFQGHGQRRAGQLRVVLPAWSLWGQACSQSHCIRTFHGRREDSWYCPHSVYSQEWVLLLFSYCYARYSRSGQAHDLPEGRIQCYCRNWPPASFVASSCHCVVTAKACHSCSVCRLWSLFLLLSPLRYSLEINSAPSIKAC